MDAVTMQSLLKMMTPIFDKYCIVSQQAKESCIRNILKNGKVLDLARSKYDMAAHLDGEATLAAFSQGAAVVQKRRKLNLGVSMSVSDKALVIAHNPDFELEFDTTKRVNHSIPYVQRIIESKRCLGNCRHGSGYISDIGGNPLFHARAGHSDVHSCMLCDSIRDLGRVTDRAVQAEAEGIFDKLRYCTNGVQCCPVDSLEAISLFALQDIDPMDLVRGLYKKGVQYLVGVFHYDPIMYEKSEGYFPYFRMHYQQYEKDGKMRVKFHFDNDSSFDYDHDMDTLLKYSRSWSYRLPGTDYAYRYDLIYVGDGLARFTVVRQNRDYLGTARNEVAYRYVDHSGSIRLNSWAIDFDSDSTSVAHAYKPVALDVPEDLFMFLYKFGLSNDTENPDKLFTVDQLRAQARTFNETRILNGVAFTGRLLMNPMDLEQLVVAMYVLVLHDMAVENYVAMAQVDTMIGKQKARSELQFLSTTGKVVGFSFALPIIFAHSKFSDFLAYIAVWFRQAASAGSLDVKWKKLCSYELLPSMQRYSGPGVPGPLQLTGHSFESRDQCESFVQPQTAYDLFADVLTEEQRALLSAKLDRPYVYSSDVDVGVPPDQDTSRSLSPVKSDFTDDSFGVEWYERDLAQYLQVKREVLWRRAQDHESVSTSELNSHAEAAVLEHARYNFDVALSQVSAAEDKCKAVYAGAPLGNKIDLYNSAEDAGIKFLQVVHGKVHVPAGESYAFGVNPVTGKYCEVYSAKGGSSYVSDKSISLLFVSKDTIILNGFHLGKALLQVALKPSPVNTKYNLVDAIYGAGKTHEIVEAYEPGVVIVTQTSASRDDIFETLSAKGRFGRETLSKSVRTADSAVMHGLPRANVVYIDEGLMMFPGQIFAMAFMTRATQIYVFGDSAQIPPIDRSTTLGFLTYQGMCRWNTIEFRNITYRSPADVVRVLAEFFKIDRRSVLKTASSVRRSLSLKVVSNPKELGEYGTDSGWHYITILRSDRAEFLTNPKMKDGKKVRIKDLAPGEARLLNVGEAQGATFPKVKVVRKYPYGDELFASPNHTVVAFSRHVLEAIYVTSVRNDPFAQLVRKAQSYTEAELDAVTVETPEWLRVRISKMKLGALKLED